jgi:hypothetical protein
VKASSRFDDTGIFLTSAEKAENNVVHRSTKGRAMAFDMQAPPSINWILPCKKISLDFCGILWRYRGLGDIPNDDYAGQ